MPDSAKVNETKPSSAASPYAGRNDRCFEIVEQGRTHPLEDIVLPRRATRESAGYDFVLPVDIEIPPHGTVQFPTDVKACMRPNDVLLLVIRSSLGTGKGLCLPNSVAVIDADYYGNPKNEGNIFAALRNTTDETVFLKKGDRYMQGIFLQYQTTTDDDATAARTGGIGSTN